MEAGTPTAGKGTRTVLGRLTARGVTSKGPGRHGDGHGLYLLVEPSGARRWLLRVVVQGKRCDIGLGSGSLVTLAEARDEARRLRKIARAGGNPLAARRQERRGDLTFKAAAEKVHAEHSQTFKNPKHRAQWLASLEADIFPVFGDRPVHTIGTDDVLKALSPIWTTKPETARRLKQRIKLVFDWAKASGYRAGDNPCDGITKVLPKVRQGATHHAALPYVDVPAFVQTLRAANAHASVRLAFEFAILTAARTSEVIGAQWSEIDRKAKVWTIPAARIKAGREHRVPLSARCLELLDAAKALTDGGGYVFPGRFPKRPLSSMAFLMALRRMERDDITAHGFRSSFRDWTAERSNAPRTVCEAALAHVVKDKTEAAYFRSDLFEQRRALMDTWAKFATTKPGKVVSLRA